MSTELKEFGDIVARMMCPDNDSRSSAEKLYESIAVAQRGSLLFHLYHQKSAGVEVRSLCLVLLRRLMSNDWSELWPIWGKGVQVEFCEQILKATGEETESILRKRLTDVIAEVARNTIDDDSGKQTWPGVIHFLELCAVADTAALRETAMVLIENVPGIFGIDQSNYLTGIREMFRSALQYAADSSVRAAAVRAYVAFLCDNDEDATVIRHLSDMIPSVLKVCEHVVATETQDDVPLQCLGDLATSVPKILRPHLAEIASLCLSTVANKEKDDAYRFSSLEVMISLCESSPAMIRKHGAQFIPATVQQCLGLMTELKDDDEDWYAVDNIDDEDEEESASTGETSLDRLACSLGGKAIFQPALTFISLLVNSQNWKERHAGIMALSTIGEGCKRTMEPMIEQIVDTILPFLADPHPRVRYAACNALGQMSSDFAPTLQKKCHLKVVAGLLELLDKLDHPRVAAHAGAALVNFSEDCPKAIIIIYLGDLMRKLEYVLDQTFKALLEKGKKLVLEQIITTIASVADAAQDRFIDFYDRLLPPLKYILQNANDDSLRLLRGKTIECISLIGLAVGREKFMNDANEIMQALLGSQTQFADLAADDPQISYMISAWARICKILGEQFAAYLPLVMPPVMRAAEFKPEVTVMTEEEAADQQSDPDWNFVSIGDQQTFGIRTAGLEDKATACEMIVCYARELKGAFADYVEPVTTLMIPLLRFHFHDGVRSAAADCMPRLLECGVFKGQQFVNQMWMAMFPALIEAIQTEHDLDVLADLMQSLAGCIEVVGSDLVTAAQLDKIVEVLAMQLSKHEERRLARDKEKDEEDHDEESLAELNELIESENGVLSRVSDIIHASFQAFREQFVPYFDKLVPQLTPLLEPRRNYGDRQWGICIWDDIIEYGGANSVKYQQNFYQPMLHALGDEYPEVRQAASYGFGVMAMYGGNAYAQACAGALASLGAMISAPNSRSTSESVTATENAISAVVKILKYNSSMVDASKVIPALLNWLPISEDTDEAPHVYGYLCDMVESNNHLILGVNNSNLPTIVTIIVDAFRLNAFADDAAGAAVKQRLVNILRQLHSNAVMFAAVISAVTFSDEQRAILEKLLTAAA